MTSWIFSNVGLLDGSSSHEISIKVVASFGISTSTLGSCGLKGSVLFVANCTTISVKKKKMHE